MPSLAPSTNLSPTPAHTHMPLHLRLQMIELLQHIPRHVATHGRHAAEYFTPDGRLRHIHTLNYWPLERVLAEKYRMPQEEVGDD